MTSQLTLPPQQQQQQERPLDYLFIYLILWLLYKQYDQTPMYILFRHFFCIPIKVNSILSTININKAISIPNSLSPSSSSSYWDHHQQYTNRQTNTQTDRQTYINRNKCIITIIIMFIPIFITSRGNRQSMHHHFQTQNHSEIKYGNNNRSGRRSITIITISFTPHYHHQLYPSLSVTQQNNNKNKKRMRYTSLHLTSYKTSPSSPSSSPPSTSPSSSTHSVQAQQQQF